MNLVSRLDRLEAHLRDRYGSDKPLWYRRLIYDPQEWDIGEDEAIAKMEAEELDRLVAAEDQGSRPQRRGLYYKGDCLIPIALPEDRLRRHDLRKANSAPGISACRERWASSAYLSLAQ